MGIDKEEQEMIKFIELGMRKTSPVIEEIVRESKNANDSISVLFGVLEIVILSVYKISGDKFKEMDECIDAAKMRAHITLKHIEKEMGK